MYSDVTYLTFEPESQHQATAVQQFENKTSKIFIGEKKEEIKRDMLPTALFVEQRAVGKRKQAQIPFGLVSFGMA